MIDSHYFDGRLVETQELVKDIENKY